MAQISDLKDLLEKDLDQLYIELGKQILSDEKLAFPFHASRYIQYAKNWLSEHRTKFIQILCNNESVKKLRNSTKLEDRVILVAAIIDLISSFCTGISPTTVSVLLVKEGIESLCTKEWDAENKSSI